MRIVSKPYNKPFILGLADDIFGLRARFFIWLPVTTHPAELRARRDSCQMAHWLQVHNPQKGTERLSQDTKDAPSTSSSLKLALLIRRESSSTGVVLP